MLPHVVAELVQTVGIGGKLEAGKYGLMNLFGSPAANCGATMQEYFHQTNDPRFMDFDPGITDRADGHRQSQPLQQREIHMDVEPLDLAIGETIGNDLESFAHCIQVSPFFRTKSRRLLETSSLRRNRENFSYCLRKEFFQ